MNAAPNLTEEQKTEIANIVMSAGPDEIRRLYDLGHERPVSDVEVLQIGEWLREFGTARAERDTLRRYLDDIREAAGLSDYLAPECIAEEVRARIEERSGAELVAVLAELERLRLVNASLSGANVAIRAANNRLADLVGELEQDRNMWRAACEAHADEVQRLMATAHPSVRVTVAFGPAHGDLHAF